MLAWTTTPWTLPSNLALCVNENLVYVKVKGKILNCGILVFQTFHYLTDVELVESFLY